MIKIGDKISERFRITSRIATGGMADVYEAYDLVGKRIVSIKV
ncbi:MAG TPA: serine/threonine protein kinase, partial [Firmicutes bacterium]|nr:serine/threonine protein kinase [Bacillota bacterium]